MIGERIQNVRRNYGETQKQLADSIHLNVNSVSGWEQGKNSISVDSVIAICKHYHVSADYLLELTEDDPAMAKSRTEALSMENRVLLRKFEAFLLNEQNKKRR